MRSNNKGERDQVMDLMAFLAIGLALAWMMAQCATP
jgi:hypothetical protein